MAHQAAAQPLSKGGIAFFSSLCATTFGLGSWQAQRYFEKIDLVQLRKEELGKEPQQLEKNATCSLVERNFGNESTNVNTNTNVNAVQKGDADIADVDRGFGPVSVRGKFMHEYEILVGPRGPPPGAISSSGPNSGRSSGGMSSSPQGFFVITPFSRSDDMGIVLVNRGWVPRQYVKQNASWGRPTGVLTVVGVTSKTEQPRFLSPVHDTKQPKQLLWLDRNAIEEKTKTRGLSPLLLTETSTDNSDGDSAHNDTDMFPVKPSKETVGEFKVLPSTHAGYAFTWFGLSSAGIFMTRKLITRGRA